MARKVVTSPSRLDVAAWLAADIAGQPCPARCSMCTRHYAVTRRGGDYTGGPVEWAPVRLRVAPYRPAREPRRTDSPREMN